MNYEQDDLINRIADLAGVEPSFFDIWGREHVTPLETKKKILRAMRFDIDTAVEAKQELTKLTQKKWTKTGPPVWVVYRDSIEPIPLQVPVQRQGKDDAIKRFRFTLVDEEGKEREKTVSQELFRESAKTELDGVRYERRLVLPPWDLDIGYYDLRVDIETHNASHTHELRLIVCPERAYLPSWMEEDGKTAGMAVSLYGVRSERNWGAGDFTDLNNLTDWAASTLRCDIIGLNPLLIIHNRRPYQHSPYLPLSRLFLNYLYLDVERADGFADDPVLAEELASTDLQEKLQGLRASEVVYYEGVAELKRRFLAEACKRFLNRPSQDPDRLAFDEFVRQGGARLRDYVTFMALYDHFATQPEPVWGWRAWPVEFHDSRSEAVARFREENEFEITCRQYTQWQLDRQLKDAQARALSSGMRIGLYHDLPLAVDGVGFDAWMRKDLFASGMSGGAPPDPFAPNGQDWGFAPTLPDELRRDGYRYFADSVRQAMKYGGAMRIDHAMQFVRLFWVPAEGTPSDGAYVKYPAEDLIGVLLLESVRNKCVVIGEDLGTVPPEIRDLFQKRAIFSYRLLYFEKNENSEFKTPDHYPVNALVSISTHDLPTLEGYWKHSDIEARNRLDIFVDREAYEREGREREHDKRELTALLGRLGYLPEWHPLDASHIPSVTPEMHSAFIGFLANTRSKVLLISQEDVFRDDRQQNMPGTTWEVPNWTTKMRFTLEQLTTDPLALGCAAMYCDWIKRTGRANKKSGG